jgi:hypothetical protein
LLLIGQSSPFYNGYLNYIFTKSLAKKTYEQLTNSLLAELMEILNSLTSEGYNSYGVGPDKKALNSDPGTDFIGNDHN